MSHWWLPSTLDVTQRTHKITNLWKCQPNRSMESQEKSGKNLKCFHIFVSRQKLIFFSSNFLKKKKFWEQVFQRGFPTTTKFNKYNLQNWPHYSVQIINNLNRSKINCKFLRKNWNKWKSISWLTFSNLYHLAVTDKVSGMVLCRMKGIKELIVV